MVEHSPQILTSEEKVTTTSTSTTLTSCGSHYRQNQASAVLALVIPVTFVVRS